MDEIILCVFTMIMGFAVLDFFKAFNFGSVCCVVLIVALYQARSMYNTK
jgi:hypothetical protein